MKITKELYSLSEAAGVLGCTESEVLEYGAFTNDFGFLTLSVFVVGEIEATADSPSKGRFSATCPLDQMEIRGVIANGGLSISVYMLLARNVMYEYKGRKHLMDDEVFVREPIEGGGWCYRYKPTIENVQINVNTVKVRGKDLMDFKQRFEAYASPQNIAQLRHASSQSDGLSTKYLANETELMAAFGCPKKLFDNVRKIPWALSARKVVGRGGKRPIPSKFDPVDFAMNLPETVYGKGTTLNEMWAKLEQHFPDRYSEVETYDPRK